MLALTAAAMTAALARAAASMDWPALHAAAALPALGGGTIRGPPPLLLLHYPLVWLQNPSYLS